MLHWVLPPDGGPQEVRHLPRRLFPPWPGNYPNLPSSCDAAPVQRRLGPPLRLHYQLWSSLMARLPQTAQAAAAGGGQPAGRRWWLRRCTRRRKTWEIKKRRHLRRKVRPEGWHLNYLKPKLNLSSWMSHIMLNKLYQFPNNIVPVSTLEIRIMMPQRAHTNLRSVTIFVSDLEKHSEHQFQPNWGLLLKAVNRRWRSRCVVKLKNLASWCWGEEVVIGFLFLFFLIFRVKNKGRFHTNVMLLFLLPGTLPGIPGKPTPGITRTFFHCFECQSFNQSFPRVILLFIKTTTTWRRSAEMSQEVTV